MSLSSQNINIVHINDRAMFDTILKCARELGLVIENMDLHPSVGPTINVPKGTTSTPALDALLKNESEIVNSAQFRFSSANGSVSMTFNRQRDQNFDRLHIDLTALPQQQVTFAFEVLAKVRKYFRATDGSDILKAIQADYSDYLSHREETLTRLEKTMTSLIVDQERYRKDLEGQYQERLQILEKDYQDKGTELTQKAAQLDKRIAEVDDREAKHARRATRESLKEMFNKRGESFKISTGTIELRGPIEWFTIALLAIFGILFTLTVLVALKLIGSAQDTDMVGLYIKQVTLGLAFASTAVFYIRWRNHWFERHAQEEFAIKRQEIDLDRATWAVELASEWVEEKKKDIPDTLLNKITSNLFETQKIEETKLHPADELSSLLFGASSKVKMKLNNGSELEYDRKGIRQLQE